MHLEVSARMFFSVSARRNIGTIRGREKFVNELASGIQVRPIHLVRLF